MKSILLKGLLLAIKIFFVVMLLVLWYLIKRFGNEIDSALNLQSYSEFLFTVNSTQSDLLIGMAGVVVTIVSVSLPIATSAISDHLKGYNSKKVYQYFINEPNFKFQIFHFAPLISGFTGIILFGLNSVFYLMLVTTVFIVSLFSFQRFIKQVIQYLTNTDEIIIKKIREEVDGYLD